jgi:predicted site-specific integrase-resolvase
MSEKYLSTSEACQELGISRATFYRKYYGRLICHPTTRMEGESPRYSEETVKSLLIEVNMAKIEARRVKMRRVRKGKKISSSTYKFEDNLQLPLFGG